MIEVRVFLNGEPVQAPAGQSVGAFLLTAGHRATRTTRFGGKPRGMFCGIGICFDCLVTIDGATNQRACVTRIVEGMKIKTQDGSGEFE